MNEYLSTFIALFGSISAITIAFLVLLYDSSKRKLDSAKRNVINEVRNFFDCPHTEKINLFKSEDNEYLQNKLITDCECNRIDKTRINKLLDILNSTITHSNSTETNKEDADHLKKYHYDDIKNELNLYDENVDYFNDFPNDAKLTIGVPFLITICFIFIGKYSFELQCLLTLNGFDYLLIVLPILGFLFIYFRAMKAINDLNKINLKN